MELIIIFGTIKFDEVINNMYNSSVMCNHKDQSQSRYGKDGYKTKTKKTK